MPDAHYPTILLEPRELVYVGPGFPIRRQVDNQVNRAGWGRVTGAFIELWRWTYTSLVDETPDIFVNGVLVGKVAVNYTTFYGPVSIAMQVLPVDAGKVHFNYQIPGRLLFEILPSGQVGGKYAAFVGPVLLHLNWEEPVWPFPGLPGAWVPPTVSSV